VVCRLEWPRYFWIALRLTWASNLGVVEYISVAFTGVAIEELDSAQQNRLRTAGRFFTNDFIQEEVSNLVLVDLVGRASAEFCQFLDRTGVAVDSSLGQASKLQIGDELLEQAAFEVLRFGWKVVISRHRKGSLFKLTKKENMPHKNQLQ